MSITIDPTKPLDVTIAVGKADKGRYEINFIGADKQLVKQATGRSDDDIEDTHSFGPAKLAQGAMIEWEIWISTPADGNNTPTFEASVSFAQSGKDIQRFDYSDASSPIWSYVTLKV